MKIPFLLKNVQRQLEALGHSAIQLRYRYFALFKNDKDLEEKFKAFFLAFHKTRQELALPTLSIATIGTTSSGKSTLVNALIGKRIAPIEAKEMSGGVLTLRHSLKRRLIIKKIENSSWESGSWEDLSDEEVYSKCKQVMLQYHQAYKETPQLEIAPEIICEGPILPGLDPSLLGFSDELALEFIDLPGLKSVLDRKNLAVIRSKVGKAFNLVVLDYNQTDEANRKKLLEELQRTVEFFNNRSDLMLFVLNRIDNRGQDDDPLEERIELLQREIKNVLQLDEEPEIIPLTARLLYNIQSAWGPTSAKQNNSPTSSLENRRNHLEALFEDCATSLKRLGKTDRRIERKLRRLEDDLDDEKLPNEEDLRRLVYQQRDWSGGTTLWFRLRDRLEKSIIEFILMPKLTDVLLMHEDLIQSLRAILDTKKTLYNEEFEKKHKDLEQIKQTLPENINTLSEKRIKSVASLIKKAVKKSKTFEQKKRVLKTLKQKKYLNTALSKIFLDLIGATDDIEKDLLLSFIKPIEKALKADDEAYDLEAVFEKVVDPKTAKSLIQANELFNRQILELESSFMLIRSENNTFSVRIREDGNTKHQKKLEQRIRDLYKNIQKSVAIRVEVLFQDKFKIIREMLTKLIEHQVKSIKEVCLTIAPGFSFNEIIDSIYKNCDLNETFAYLSSFFTLLPAIKWQYGNLELILPDENGIIKQWENHIKDVKVLILEDLQKHIVTKLQNFNLEVLKQINVTLSQQLQNVENEYLKRTAFLEAFNRTITQLELLGE